MEDDMTPVDWVYSDLQINRDFENQKILEFKDIN